jgi:hypothetical protein
METQRMWIVDQPFTRKQYSSITNGGVDYSGYLYNDKGPNLTPDQYLAHPEVVGKYTAPRIVTNDEFSELYYQSTQELKTPFKEVTEAQYWEALECLPPMKWRDIAEGVNVFFISEAYTADLHACYIHDRRSGKYYGATRSVFETNAQLMEIFERSIG